MSAEKLKLQPTAANENLRPNNRATYRTLFPIRQNLWTGGEKLGLTLAGTVATFRASMKLVVRQIALVVVVVDDAVASCRA
jgi:hypothetical protein